METAMRTCPQHPRYRAKRPPKSCKVCQEIFDEECQKAMDEHCDEIAARAETQRQLYAEEALLTLGLLKELAHDVWGSADLHFNGDCFDEFEWCVIMRGGGFSQHRTYAEGKTAFEAVLAGLTVKIRECRSKEYRKHLKGLQKYYGQKHAEINAKRRALR